MEALTKPCAWCGKPVEQSQRRGRPRRWCDDSCRKKYERRFFPLPEGLSPLPDPGPLPKGSPHDRLILVLTNIASAPVELRIVARELEAPLTWRALELADRVEREIQDTFGGVFHG
jgi:hypothetical protein